MSRIEFPPDFLFGVATSAAQIEGAAATDGRGPSIWDAFAAQAGTIGDGSTPAQACDFYHRYPQDLALARQLNIESFRFSFSWSRIFPDGYGAVNQQGLDYYKRLIEALYKQNMVPNATIYHWDLPQALEEKGGWLNRDVVSWYGEYAEKLFREFGADIPLWATVNEPIATYVGYAQGIFAPGHCSEAQGRQANHHILLAHGEGVRRFRAEHLHKSQIGIVVDVWKHHPYRPGNADDIKMAELENEKSYRSYLNPLFHGGYTPALWQYMTENNCQPQVRPEDFAAIKEPLDFFGLNCYNRVVDCADPTLLQTEASRRKRGGNFQDNGQEYYPRAVYEAAVMLRDEYQVTLPIYLTENGTPSYDETVTAAGAVHDENRVHYIQGFLYWIRRALAAGIDIRGYYVWSLTDNWEWNSGFASRFGLTHLDYQTQRRTIKDSGKWYAKMIAQHGFEYEEEKE